MLLLNFALADEVANITSSTAGTGFIPAGLVNFLPMLVILFVFYFLLIRPQMKKQKQMQEMINSLKKGDKVVVAGGIVGTINKIDEQFAIVSMENGDSSIKVLRSAVSDVLDNKKLDTPKAEKSHSSNKNQEASKKPRSKKPANKQATQPKEAATE